MSYDVELLTADSVESSDGSGVDYEYVCLIDGAYYEESTEAAGNEIPESGWNRFFVKSYFKEPLDRAVEPASPDEVHFDVEIDSDGLGGGLHLERYYPQDDDINNTRLFEPEFSISMGWGKGPVAADVTFFNVPIQPDDGGFDSSSDQMSASWTISLDSFPESHDDAAGVRFDVNANEGVEEGNHTLTARSSFGYTYNVVFGGIAYGETKEVETQTDLDIV